jgi:hypothetical protein
VVEPRHGYFETSFMPGREFSPAADFNTQFTAWLAIANARVVRTTKAPRWTRSAPIGPRCCPCHQRPQVTGWVNRVRLGRDYYVCSTATTTVWTPFLSVVMASFRATSTPGAQYPD